jgi:NO-binding membrane sensor protein with MHYT domain
MSMNLEYARQVVFLSSILAGFAVAIEIELTSRSDKKQETKTAIEIFATTSLAMLVATFMGSVVLIQVARYPEGQAPKEIIETAISITSIAFFLIFSGLLMFVVGIGLTGRLHSSEAGVTTGLLSAVAALAILAFFFYSMSKFP